MSGDRDKVTRWRPRFSVRTLVVIVTLVCAYAACWGPTKKWGTQQVPRQRSDAPPASATAIAPLLVAVDEVFTGRVTYANGMGSYGTQGHRHYYFWFFGYVAKLPYERDTGTPPLPPQLRETRRPSQPAKPRTS